MTNIQELIDTNTDLHRAVLELINLYGSIDHSADDSGWAVNSSLINNGYFVETDPANPAHSEVLMNAVKNDDGSYSNLADGAAFRHIADGESLKTFSANVGSAKDYITWIEALEIDALGVVNNSSNASNSSFASLNSGDALPGENQGLIWHEDYNSFLTWQKFDQNGANYEGYASVDVGKPDKDGQPTPRKGQLVQDGASHAIDAYPALYHWAQHHSLMLPAEDWIGGWFRFANNGDGTFNVPDTRNLFYRNHDDRTDREFGDYQADEFKEHKHNLRRSYSGNGSYGPHYQRGRNDGYIGDAIDTAEGGEETRPVNFTLLPTIHY